VFVLAGVPMIMRAMLEDVGPRLPRGRVVISQTIQAQAGEGRIAGPLAQIQRDHPGVAIGSHPAFADGGPRVQLVVRGRDGEAVEQAAVAIEAALLGDGIASTRMPG
jgi:molybdopterin-biosynthesis enzyme MoeA-like protein